MNPQNTDTPKKRYIGLHLGGPKSSGTSMVVFDVFEEDISKTKISRRFLVDIVDKISSNDPMVSSDELLIKAVSENSQDLQVIGIDAPLTLPPCMGCELDCPGASACEVPAVSWLREELVERARNPRNGKRPKPIAPYSERPVDIYLRRFLDQGYGNIALIEALGATMATKAARAYFLKKHLFSDDGIPLNLVEVNPTLSLAMLKSEFSLNTRDLKYYKDLQEGAKVRMRILDRLNEENTVFLYEQDIGSLVASIPAFYAFICAYTAYLNDSKQTLVPEKGFPVDSGWIAVPETKEK
jgi:hypothetical protein